MCSLATGIHFLTRIHLERDQNPSFEICFWQSFNVQTNICFSTTDLLIVLAVEVVSGLSVGLVGSLGFRLF